MAGSIPNSTNRLLNGAVGKFSDIPNPFFAIPATYYVSTNGFGYILMEESKKEPVEIVAVHMSHSQEQIVDGIRDSATCSIQINKSLDEMMKTQSSCVLVQYLDYYIMVNSLKGFNNQTSIYHYSGQVLASRNKNFIITSEAEAQEHLNINSMGIWLKNQAWFPIPIFPSYISPFNMDTPYMAIDVTETVSLNMTTKIGDKIYQYNKDKVKLYLINGTTEIAQEMLYLINRLYPDYDASSFGVMNFLEWYQSVADRQSAFGIMTNRKMCDAEINYWLTADSSSTLEYFRGMIAQINGHEIELYKPD